MREENDKPPLFFEKDKPISREEDDTPTLLQIAMLMQ